jgi:uncharacterized coiled-coil DUF342 family protein
VPTDDWLRLNQERDELRAEVERLNQALDMVAEEREAWKAEVERLRAALEKIADPPDMPDFGDMRQIAREALDGEMRR